jgi:signal peptidase II
VTYFSAEAKRLILIVVALTAATLPLDQISKQYAKTHYLLVEDQSDSTIYQGRREELVALGSERIWLSLSKTYVRNHGASWGVWSNMDELWRRPLILVMGLVATMALYFVAVRLLLSGHDYVAFSLCGVIAGSFGNMLDRLRLGYVVDFLTLKMGADSGSYVLPSFNVADIIIILSLICLISTIHVRSRHQPRGA